MKFAFQKNADIYDGELLYISEDQSLFFNPCCTQPSFSVMISGAYTSLDVDCRNGQAKHISGCNPKHLWHSKTLIFPESLKGNLFVKFDAPLPPGTGEYYANSWSTYHDENGGTLCIGNPETEDGDDAIEFANGIVAVLRGDNLIAIWATIREVKNLPTH